MDLTEKNRKEPIQMLVEHDAKHQPPVDNEPGTDTAAGEQAEDLVADLGDPEDTTTRCQSGKDSCVPQNLQHLGDCNPEMCVQVFARERQAEREFAERQAERDRAERQAQREQEAVERQREREYQLQLVRLQMQLPAPQHPASSDPVPFKPCVEPFPEMEKDGEVYRKKFRALQRGPKESYANVLGHLTVTFDQWTSGLSITNYEDLKDLVIREQFLDICPEDMRQFILDQQPKDAAHAARIADAYVANRTLEVRKPAGASWKRDDDDETWQFHQELCHYEDHAVRMIHEYFQDDLQYIVENLTTISLLSELRSRNISDLEKYQSLERDRRTFARTLLEDIFHRGREAVIALWVSLYVLRRHHDSPGLSAVLEELRQTGSTLVEQILLDEDGHPPTPALDAVQNCHKKHLHEKNEKLLENQPPRCNQRKESFSLCTRYVNLIIVSTQHFRERSENELTETGVRHEEYLKKAQNELQRIFPNKLFRLCPRSRLVPHVIMVSGVPGVGKTTLMQKFVYDWVKGDLYQRFSFVFFFKFRELNRLDEVSLETMILRQYPHLREQLGNILQDPEKLLFIFDGLDESNHTMDFTSHHLYSDPKQPGHCGEIVVSLVTKSLLNGCSVLMTSRPTRLASIDCKVFERIVEITGFFPEERQIYFENFFFPDPKLAEKAFKYVKENGTLYTFCYLPSYCWIICTVLSKSFQPTTSDQPASILPKTVTQLFAIFVANILSNHSLDKSDAQKILKSIGWMAEHGVMNHRVIFDERDLDSFYVDNKSKLLSSFVIESEEPVTYSFLHLTVQEFFSALVHYTDYSPEKLQKSLEEAKSYPDGRGEIFLRFLCGLSDGSSRSILTEYMDKQAAQASRDVITWLMNLIPQEQGQFYREDKRRYLLSTFYYLFETRNKDLVLESFRSYRNFDLPYVHMSALDCTVLAFILEICTNIKELNLYRSSLDTEGLERLAPGLHHIQKLSLRYNALPDTSCIQLASIIRNNPSLKKLDLSDNRLSGPHFNHLMEALSCPDCAIEELHLGSNNLLDTSCTQLASVIRYNPSLKILDLSHNSLSGPRFSDLVEALSSPDCRILELDLGFCELSYNEKEVLRELETNNQNMKILTY